MHDASTERVRSALNFISPDLRDVWVRQGAAIKDEFGDAGFDIWDEWGSSGHGHNARSAKSTWKSFKKSGVGIGSLFYDAKQAGWPDDGKQRKVTAAEIEQRQKLRLERDVAAAVEEALLNTRAAEHAQEMWDRAGPADAHPYLIRKGVPSYGLRVGDWEFVDYSTGEVFTFPNCLLIPMRDRQRKLHSLQCIDASPEKPKRYLKDGAKQGHFFPIGKPVAHDGRPVFILAEGYATAASVHAATGHMVLVCFDASNLVPVAVSVRERSPDAIILMAADNDIWTKGNPGMAAAGKAALAVDGLVVAPPFTEDDETSEGQGPKDWNDWYMIHGAASVAALIAAALVKPGPAPEPPPAPESEPEVEAAAATPIMPNEDGAPDDLHASGHFTVLGYNGDQYFFFHHGKRQVLARTKSDFSDIGLIELAPRQWWEMYYAKANGAGFDKLAAAEWIFALSHARGIYNAKRVRGRGAWNDKGRLVFHHGDHLTVDGVETPIAKIQSGYVYPMSDSMPEMTEAAATDAQGQHLLEISKLVRWSKPASAALMAGWVFLSPVCGALPWRPHIWLTGPAGSGKSFIQEHFCYALVNGIGEYIQGNSSEAGLRQRLGSDAVPALIDELEPNDDGDRKRISNILTVIRQSSSESGAQTVKGTVSGGGMSFHIRSMFCAASINTMLDKDSDSSRITQLIMRSASKSGATDDNWNKLSDAVHMIEKDGKWPARLLARSLALLPTILANVDVFCRVAALQFGTQRHGDQFGTLMAGAWCLTSSKVATDAEAKAMLDSYDWTEHKEEGKPDDPVKALGAVLEAKIRVSNTDVTVFELVAEACGQVASKTVVGESICVDTLNRNGLRILGGELLFASSSSALRELVAKTPYYSDLRGQLLRIPGSNRFGNRTLKFSGTGSKCVAIPLSFIFDVDEPPF